MKTLISLCLFLPSVLAFSAMYHEYQPQNHSVPPPEPQPLYSTLCPKNITPPTSPLSINDADLIIDAEFLWWQSTVTNLTFATEVEVTPQGNVTNPTNNVELPKELYELNWNWDPGFRLALGVNTDHDGWDVTGDWTYFFNRFSNSESVPSPLDGGLFDVEENSPGTALLFSQMTWTPGYSIATSIRAKGSLQLNQFDLELGRNFWISPTLILRPYGGLRGHVSHLKVQNKRHAETNSTLPNVQFGLIESRSRYHQKVWGVGLLGGLNTCWKITKYFSMFGEGDFSLLYGPFNNRVRFKTFGLNETLTVQTHNTRFSLEHEETYTLFAIIDLTIGIRFENTWLNAQNKEIFRALLDLGWEHHIYPSYNRFDLLAGQKATILGNSRSVANQNNFRPANGDLTLMGFVARARIEF